MEFENLVDEIKKLTLKEKHILGEELRKMLSKGDKEVSRSEMVGKLGEAFFEDIFKNNLLTEIKTEDKKWVKTGKVYIENLQHSSFTGRMELSGVMTTTSDLWVTVLLKDGKPHCAIINKTEWLKDNVRKFERYSVVKVKNKDGSETAGYAIPLEILIGLKEIE